MLRRLDEDEIVKIAPTMIVGASNMARDITIISESGLYSAILGSKKPEAKKFKKHGKEGGFRQVTGRAA